MCGTTRAGNSHIWVWLVLFSIALASTAIFRRDPIWLLVFDLSLAIFFAFMAGVSYLNDKMSSGDAKDE
ncbi:MAG: hypothetical protein ABIS18_01820 [Actinomycetota bacterium]